MKFSLFKMIILSIALIVQNVFAYPILPRPLRQLVMESEYIVYAKVIDVTKVGEYEAVATLNIEEQLQGNLKDKKIKVKFGIHRICPLPASYSEGTYVLAFLDKNKDEQSFSTHALSYGAKRISSSAFKTYKQRIIEIQQILKIKSDTERTKQTIDWLVRNATNQHTYWQGFFELRNHQFSTRLSKHQKSLLRKAFFEMDISSRASIRFSDLIAKDNDIELQKYFLQRAKKERNKELWQAAFLKKVVELSHREDLLTIAEQLESLAFSHKEKDKKKGERLVQEFIEKWESKM